MTKNWPFDPILATVSLSNSSELLASEGYEFGGYLFHPEEMGNLGQFSGNKLKRFGSQPLLGVSHGCIPSSPESRSNSSQPTPFASKVAGANSHRQSSNGTASSTIRRPGGKPPSS